MNFIGISTVEKATIINPSQIDAVVIKECEEHTRFIEMTLLNGYCLSFTLPKNDAAILKHQLAPKFNYKTSKIKWTKLED